MAVLDSDRLIAWIEGDEESSSDWSDAPSAGSVAAALSGTIACRAKNASACFIKVQV